MCKVAQEYCQRGYLQDQPNNGKKIRRFKNSVWDVVTVVILLTMNVFFNLGSETSIYVIKVLWACEFRLLTTLIVRNSIAGF